MNDDISNDIKILKNEIERLKESSQLNKDLCFKQCELNMENKFSSLIDDFREKNSKRLDRYRNTILFSIAVLTFIGSTVGAPSLVLFINDAVRKTVEDATRVATENIKIQVDNEVKNYLGATKKEVNDLENYLKTSLNVAEKLFFDLKETTNIIYLKLAKSGNFESIKNLITIRKIDPNISDEEGRCLLYWATVHGKHDVIEELFKCNAKADCSGPIADNNTPLLISLRLLEFNIASSFMDNNADLNKYDSESNTPLHYSIVNNRPDITKKLINKGADVDLFSNTAKDFPLIEATRQNDENTVQLVLDKTKRVDCKNSSGETALIVAVENSYTQIAKILVNRGADKQIAYNWSKYIVNQRAEEFLDKLSK